MKVIGFHAYILFQSFLIFGFTGDSEESFWDTEEDSKFEVLDSKTVKQ